MGVENVNFGEKISNRKNKKLYDLLCMEIYFMCLGDHEIQFSIIFIKNDSNVLSSLINH